MTELAADSSALDAYERYTLFSDYLNREVLFDVYRTDNSYGGEPLNLLLVNDGQDLLTMPFHALLKQTASDHAIQPLLVIGIHCGSDRKQEYGIAYAADYMGRGSKAGLYTKFILDELLPFIRKRFHIVSFREKAMAGFSLGGLSALDLIWNHASEFSKVGIFSPSLWWRRKSYEEGYDEEKDRLMHLQIRKGICYPWLQFFIQCGAMDETADRNKNGIIDSVDDALDLVVELKAKGYNDEHIHYLELIDGKHDVATWARVLPDFIRWGWAVKQ
jgi:enterochelin esterase-like enzyme